MSDHWTRLMWIAVFAAAFGYVEAAVVVYLRGLYYPEGFSLPLKPIELFILLAEIGREVATMVMLVAAALLAGRGRCARFGMFLVAFGVWDIFYYVWLKVLLDWPSSLLEWDVLFLIPVPWLAPVLAPVLISLLLIAAGVLLVHAEANGRIIRIPLPARIGSAAGVVILLFTFLRDSFHPEAPESYAYAWFIIGILCLLSAILMTIFAGNPARPQPGADNAGETRRL